jgi:alkylation response protein AidB-like acyl-CoA dehydrogenase
MRFAISEEAAALRDAARDVLAAEVTTEVIRSGTVDAAWQKLAAVGVFGTLVPEEHGGLGLDENAIVPLLDEIGYSGLPGPVVETIAVGAPLVSRSLGDSGRYSNENPPTIMTAVFDNGDLVPFGQCARLIVLRDGDSLRVYERDELRLQPCTSIDASRFLSRLTQRPQGGGVLLTDDAAEVDRAWQRGVLGTSATLTGLARRMLAMTVEYVKRREQFGVPVGSFQAIKHALADALVAIEFARPLVLAAAWAQAAGTENASTLTSAAKVRATAAALRAARTAIQCHGAMGYTTEYDLHLFAKRVWALAPSWGDAGWHRARIAENLGVSDG